MLEWQKKLPMRLTMARIYMVVPCILALIPDQPLWNFVAAVIFMVASITDYYDGYYARKFGAISNMGKFMDPIADKILVTSILTMLIVHGKVDPYLVILLTVRDTFIGGIRAVAAADGVIIAARTAGKWKAALQMGAIPAVVIGSIPFLPGLGDGLGRIGYVLLWVSAVLSITSAIEYYRAYLEGRKNV